MVVMGVITQSRQAGLASQRFGRVQVNTPPRKLVLSTYNTFYILFLRENSGNSVGCVGWHVATSLISREKRNFLTEGKRSISTCQEGRGDYIPSTNSWAVHQVCSTGNTNTIVRNVNVF